ncbi:MAG: hypothetical protein HC862_24755 [Scytonema sp. RU_4_4]|nr:hypothetical protein [Scytonema sp. RU_4_4]NJR74094.1 hypothetical protein [Scytonema sp. CRU_2_7]
MKEIKIKSTGISIFASVVTGLGLLGAFTSKNQNVKNLSATLFFSAASAGLVTACKSSMDTQDANDQLKRILDKVERERIESSGLLDQSAKITAKLAQELEITRKQLELAEVDLQAVQVSLQIAEESLRRKCQEAEKAESLAQELEITGKRLGLAEVDLQTFQTMFQEFLKEYTFKTANLLIVFVGTCAWFASSNAASFGYNCPTVNQWEL